MLNEIIVLLPAVALLASAVAGASILLACGEMRSRRVPAPLRATGAPRPPRTECPHSGKEFK